MVGILTVKVQSLSFLFSYSSVGRVEGYSCRVLVAQSTQIAADHDLKGANSTTSFQLSLRDVAAPQGTVRIRMPLAPEYQSPSAAAVHPAPASSQTTRSSAAQPATAKVGHSAAQISHQTAELDLLCLAAANECEHIAHCDKSAQSDRCVAFQAAFVRWCDPRQV